MVPIINTIEQWHVAKVFPVDYLLHGVVHVHVYL